MLKVEFRVVPTTRYIVTRYTNSDDEKGTSGSAESVGEFDNEVLAANTALAFADHETLSSSPPDEIKTTRPNTPEGHEQVRTWTRGEGWDDCPVAD